MQVSYTTLAALLVVSTTTAAELPADSPSYSQSSEQHIYLAQAAPSEARAAKERDSDQHDSRRAPTEDETLALTALEGLMAQPAQRALPIIKKVLAGSQSTLVKRRALFVLSQIHDPEAQTLLLDTAKSGDPALRGEAIRSIGIGGDEKSLAVLQDVYAGGDDKTRKQVLQAWLISGNKSAVYQAALNAKTDEEANSAIRTLSVMGAVDELRKLGELKKPGHDLVEAYAIAGDLTSLRKIASGNGDTEARTDAVRKIGIIHSQEARTALREIYASATTPEIKDAALQGMLIGGDDEGVLALYRISKNAEDKRALLRTLSLMNGDAALQAIDAALESKK